MRKQINKTVAVALLMLFTLTSVHAQTSNARRISFGRGRSSAVVRGVIGRDATIAYIIGARAGQTMDLDITRGAAFRLYTPSGGQLQGGRGVSGSTDELDETGDYRIEVEHRSRRRNVPFTLRATIR